MTTSSVDQSVNSSGCLNMALVFSGHQVSDVTSMEREFIKRYEQLPLLWKRDHPDYCNKYRRNLAYDKLLVILRRLLPSANRFSVRQKINILRSTYRKEVRRYLASKTITSEGEIIHTYNPPSWKFEAMKFLLDQNENDSKMEIPQSEIEEETVEDDTFNDLEEQELVFIHDVQEETEIEQDELALTENPKSPLYAPLYGDHKKPVIVRSSRKRGKYDHGHMLSKYNSERDIIDRECSAVGSNVTCKLQRMTIDQRLFAEQLINKILVRGLQRTLSDETEFTESIQFFQKAEVENEDS